MFQAEKGRSFTRKGGGLLLEVPVPSCQDPAPDKALCSCPHSILWSQDPGRTTVGGRRRRDEAPGGGEKKGWGVLDRMRPFTGSNGVTLEEHQSLLSPIYPNLCLGQLVKRFCADPSKNLVRETSFTKEDKPYSAGIELPWVTGSQLAVPPERDWYRLFGHTQ